MSCRHGRFPSRFAARSRNQQGSAGINNAVHRGLMSGAAVAGAPANEINRNLQALAKPVRLACVVSCTNLLMPAAEHGQREISNDLQALTMAGADCASAAAIAGASVLCAAANGFVLSPAQLPLMPSSILISGAHERQNQQRSAALRCVSLSNYCRAALLLLS